MTRAHGDHLSDDEKEKLYRDIRAGLPTSYLTHAYNIADRTVAIHRAKINGTYSKERPISEGRNVTRDVKRICLCNECYDPVLEGSAFCAKHDPQPHENRARLMAGRA